MFQWLRHFFFILQGRGDASSKRHGPRTGEKIHGAASEVTAKVASVFLAQGGERQSNTLPES